jgi:hypothetical protein
MKQFTNFIPKRWVILKLDFEKAYDKVKWSFLQQTLRMKGFSPEWHTSINVFMSVVSVAIRVNVDTSCYFQTRKGLRQGDPLSPMLFNIVAHMLAILIERAKFVGQIEGVIPHLVDGGLSILQYADDTIIFMEHDLEKAQNLKLILAAFEQLSGLKDKTSIRVNCFVLVMLRMQLAAMQSCLAVGKANSLSGSWASRFIIRD